MFRNYVIRNFPFLEDDFDALTDYQLFCKFMGYVKKVANDNKEIKKQVDELEEYVKNLDIQDAVNNKLDEMLADGDFDDMISYLTGTTLLNVLDEIPEDKVENSLYEDIQYNENLAITEIPVSNYKLVNDDNFNAVNDESHDLIKVLTYNIENENVPYTDGINGLEKINKLKNILNNVGASIVGLNETFNGYLYPANKMYTTDFLKYASFGQTMTSLTNYFYGNTTVSKKQPVETSVITYVNVGNDGEKRCAIKTVYNINGKNVSHYNTHLSWDANTYPLQLAELYTAVSSDTNDYIIISGDFNFNLEDADTYLADFLDDNFKLVNNGNYHTFPSNDTAIDEIMVSSNIDIEDSGMLSQQESENISDHLPLYALLKLN